MGEKKIIKKERNKNQFLKDEKNRLMLKELSHTENVTYKKRNH